MFGFKKKVAPVAEQDDIKSRRERWIGFIEESCKKHLSDISNFKHPDWEKAETAEDFRTLATMYTAACAAYEQHADQMFSQWIKFAKGVDIDAEKTTEFYFMVNRRFSHLAQVRCFLDYQLKLTLVPADIRLKTLPQLAKLLAHEMSDAFFPTPAAPNKPSDNELLIRSSSPDGPASLREEVGILYDRGVNPLRAVRALFHDADGNLITDARKIADIWRGINDLLDRDGIENTLRTQLVGLRDVLAKTLEESSPEAKTLVANYRESTRHINEMKFLQAYKPKLVDSAGVMQLEALKSMLAEIEYEKMTNLGSLAQDISDETLARLYKLRDNWDDPSKLE